MKTGMAVLALVAAVSVGVPGAWAGEVAPGDVKIVDGVVNASITGAAGDAVEGAKVFKNRKLGNCLACHANTDMNDELFHGEVGPELDGVAERYTAEEMRAIIINSKEVFGDQTIMPGFYTLDLGVRVAEKFQGKTILSAQQVEDVLAYLNTLK